MNIRKSQLLVIAVITGMLLVQSITTRLPYRAQAKSGSGYELSWWTADGGGGRLNGGGLVVQGTVGQPDASVLTGSGYRLMGGFWSGGLDNHTVFLPVMVKN
jgi:hypothetical protein